MRSSRLDDLLPALTFSGSLSSWCRGLSPEPLSTHWSLLPYPLVVISLACEPGGLGCSGGPGGRAAGSLDQLLPMPSPLLGLLCLTGKTVGLGLMKGGPRLRSGWVSPTPMSKPHPTVTPSRMVLQTQAPCPQ